MEFFTKFNPPPQVGLEFTEPSMTEQHFKDECDINNIVAQYQLTGVLPQGDRQPLFGDFADFPRDLMSAQQYFDEAQERFMQLDAQIRKEFGNNPAMLLDFIRDESNRERAIELGLIDKPAPAESTVHLQETNVVSNPENQQAS